MDEAKRIGLIHLTLVRPDGTRTPELRQTWISVPDQWLAVGAECEAEIEGGDIWIRVLSKSGPNSIEAKQVDDPKRFMDELNKNHCFRFRKQVRERAVSFKSLKDDGQEEQLRKILVGRRDELNRLAESRIKTGKPLLISQEQGDDEQSWIVAIEDILAILDSGSGGS